MTNKHETEKVWTKQDFEDNARMIKAGLLARAAHNHGIDAETAELLAARDWNILAILNGIRLPSAATVAKTIFVLRTVEKVTAQ